VIVAPNWLGDAVMALPAIADVRRALPAATITIAARPAIAPLFGLLPDLRVVTREPRPWPDGRELTASGFDAAILLPNSFRAALEAARARIPERWGYRTDWRGRLLTRAIPPPRRAHQIEYYRHLMSALGFANGPAEPSLAVPNGARQRAETLLKQAGWSGDTPLVAIAPGAAYGSAKRWPAESFAALVYDLTRDGIDVLTIGSAADRRVAADLERAFRVRYGGERPDDRRGRLMDLSGRTDLVTLAGVFTYCRTLVTNDSGAMHLAAAVGTPVTAVFGPTDDRATHPVGAAHRTIIGDAWCRPCMLRECPIDHRCMRRIAPETVAAAARRAL
jgi:heptosyltransferase-2